MTTLLLDNTGRTQIATPDALLGIQLLSENYEANPDTGCLY